jgi:hypothetical protein
MNDHQADSINEDWEHRSEPRVDHYRPPSLDMRVSVPCTGDVIE